VFQRTQAFPLGQRAPHSTFPTHHRLWDTTESRTLKWKFLNLLARSCRSLKHRFFLTTIQGIEW